MKQLLLLLSIFFAALFAAGQTTPQVRWSANYGGSTEDHSYSIATDASGNVYAAGTITGYSIFGSSLLVSAGYEDILLYKSDANGNLVWARRFGGSYQDYGQAVTTDADGNIYVTGSFKVSATFGPYTINATAPSNIDMFIVKVDPSGNVLWVRHFGGNTLYVSGASLNTDAAGNVYVTGMFNEDYIVIGTTTLTSVDKDAFLAKLDPDGNVLWARQFGNPSAPDFAFNVQADANGNTYTSGMSYESGVFDGFTIPGNANDYTGFLVKTDPDGNVLWANAAGMDVGSSSLDGNGFVYSFGEYTGTISLGSSTYNSNGNTDVFITKTDIDGNLIWSRTFGSAASDVRHSIAADGDGNSYFTGLFHGPVVFQDGVPVSPAGNYIVKLNSAGAVLWAKSLGNNSNTPWGMALNSAGSPHLTGNLFGTWAIDDFTLTSNGTAGDTYVLKIGADCTINSTLTPSACGSYILNGQTYTSSGLFTQTFEASAGCDSTVTINLTISQPSDSTLTQTACGSYTLNAQTYTNSGIYTQIRPNAAGCDSTITLNLTIRQPSVSDLTQYACESYTLNAQTYTASGVYSQVKTNAAGCDSTITLNLTILQPSNSTLTQTACGSYTLNSQTYTTSGIYTQTQINAAGCDSTITLHLTIGNADAAVTQDGITLTAAAGADSYQWIRCTGTPLAGMTQQTFTASQNGSYAVIVTDQGCVDTSGCFVISTIGLDENMPETAFEVFPNPADGTVTISLAGMQAATVKLYHADGKIIRELSGESDVLHLDLSGQVPGIYIIEVEADGKLGRKKLVKR